MMHLFLKPNLLFTISLFLLSFAQALGHGSGHHKKEDLETLKTQLLREKTALNKAKLQREIGIVFSETNPDSSLIYHTKALHYFSKNSLDSLEIESMVSIANNYLRKGIDSLWIDQYEKAIVKAEKQEFLPRICSFCYSFGNALLSKGKTTKAIPYYEKAIKIGTEIKLHAKVAPSYNNLGLAYYYLGEFEKATDHLILSEKYREENGMPVSPSLLINISGILVESKNFDRAIEYNEKAISLATKEGDKDLIKACYQNIGVIQTQQKKYTEAKESLYKAFLLSQELNDSISMVRYYIGVGDIAIKEKNDPAALKSYLQSEKHFPVNGDPRQLMFIHTNIGNTYSRIAQANNNDKALFRKASTHLLKAYNMADQLQLKKNKGESSGLLFNVYEGLGQYDKATFYGKEYMAMKDSLVSEEKIKALAEQQTKYETEKKELEIQLLNQENAAKSESIAKSESLRKNQLTIIYLLIGGFLLTCALLLVIFKFNRRMKKANQELIEKNELISTQKEEKEVLLKEIHHRVKNNLQVISGLLELQSFSVDNPEFKNAVEDGKNRIHSMAMIHEMLYQNKNVGELKFEEYIAELIDKIKQSYVGSKNILSELYIDEQLNFDLDTAIPLGLIVTELYTNSLKYASGTISDTKIQVQCKENNGKYLLEVKDNGIGLPNNFDITKAKSLGIRLVHNLAKQIGGEVNYRYDNGSIFSINFQGSELA